MDVKLKTFLTLLEEKNYTKTAKKLFITQPAVTHHIKQLESDYKISLFVFLLNLCSIIESAPLQ